MIQHIVAYSPTLSVDHENYNLKNTFIFNLFLKGCTANGRRCMSSYFLEKNANPTTVCYNYVNIRKIVTVQIKIKVKIKIKDIGTLKYSIGSQSIFFLSFRVS